MNPDTWIKQELERARRNQLERSISVVPEAGGILRDVGGRVLNLSSNDYLNLIHHPLLQKAATEALSRYGTGSGSSRLVSGTLPIHEELEAGLATLKGYPAALTFGSGFLANAGAITAMVGRNDHVFADRLAHASIVDATIQSRAKLHRFNHNDVDHLASLLGKTQSDSRKLVITESVFSMDGDFAPLRELATVCEEYEAIFAVDEAHATGLFGMNGAGRISEEGLQDCVALSIGTMSKALGGYGGFVASSNLVRQWLINRARPLIYSTALPPSVAATAHAALQVLSSDPQRGRTVLRLAAALRHRLQEENLDTLNSQSQIIPILVGDNKRTLRISQKLQEEGILAIPIRPPTVPAGTARLRLSVTYAHTEEDLREAAETIIRVVRKT